MVEENQTERAIFAQVQENKEALAKIYASVEKTRKLFLWTLIITIVAFVLPLVGLALAIPFFINTYIAPLAGSALGL
jgi:hypothetical protein